MACIEIHNLSKVFPHPQGELHVLKDLSLCIDRHSFTVILGRSGCGKTTLLRMIAGLEQQTSGQVIFHPETQKVGFVFQEARLMPWLNVQDNVRFLHQDIAHEELLHILHLLKLQPFAHFYPREISGGMAQKAAIGRALCYQSDIILMDEPFASLDYFTRGELQQELLHIFDSLSKTIIFVTHNIDEAILLGDNIVILDEGKIAHILHNKSDRAQRQQIDYQDATKQKIIELLQK